VANSLEQLQTILCAVYFLICNSSKESSKCDSDITMILWYGRLIISHDINLIFSQFIVAATLCIRLYQTYFLQIYVINVYFH